jgi:NitT/TauT family transport system substrate-binding protein
MVRYLLSLGTVAAVAVLVTGCWRNEAPATAPESESVTVAVPLALQSTLVFLAKEKRYFDEQGLNVTVKPLESGAAAGEAMVRGQADVALYSEVVFVHSTLDKGDVRLLATLYRSRANTALVARKDRGIASPRDLAGKRIGIIANTGAEYFASSYLEMQGIKSGQANLVPLAVGKAETALLNGDVDAVALFHPYSTRLVAKLGVQAVVFSDPAIYQMQINLVAPPAFAASRPQVARRFLLALDNALNFLRENPEEARRLAVKATNEDPVVFGKMWQVNDFILALNQGLLSVLEDEARWTLAKKPTAQATLPNFLDFIDAGPLQSVRADAVTILLP